MNRNGGDDRPVDRVLTPCGRTRREFLWEAGGGFVGTALTALLAGRPAAALVVAVTVPLVWWAFIPPYFEFNTLVAAHIDAITMFLLLSLLLIFLADGCRERVNDARRIVYLDGRTLISITVLCLQRV